MNDTTQDDGLAAAAPASASEAPAVEKPKAAPAGGGKKPPAKPPTKTPAPKKAAAPKPAKAPVSDNPAQRRAEKTLDAKRAAKPSTPKAASEGPTKTEMLIAMMSKPGGATSAEMEKAAGWQPHSVRGIIGTLKTKGYVIVSKKLPKEPTIYQMTAAPPAKAPEAVGDVV